MKSLVIEHNMAIELVGALTKIGIKHKIEEALDEYNFGERDKNILAWHGMVEQKMSPFLKADVDLLVKNFYARGWADMHIIMENEIESPVAFIDYLKKMDSKAYIKKCFENYDFQKREQNITYDSPDEAIKKAIADRLGEDEGNLFIQFKKYPEELKRKTIHLYEQFYSKFFKDYEVELQAIMTKKVKEHNLYLHRHQKNFFEVLAMGDLSKLINRLEEFRLLVCYFLEVSVTLSTTQDERLGFLVYGASQEKLFDNKFMKENSKQLFKALSDEKRLELLKLIGKRKWFSNELAEHFGITSATMSYHINKLVNIGMVQFESGEQNKFFYSVNEERVKELFQFALEDLLEES